MKRKLEIIHPFAAGIDIGSKSFYVDAGEEKIKVFSTFTDDCSDLAKYLLSQKVTTVAMESTGVYWVVLYSILEEAGMEVFLVNGRDVKNLPGRKSDVKDCQWLRELHSYGLLRKSFIPPNNIRIMRSILRLRQDHIRASATQINLMNKALIQMNIRLSEVIDDITGVSGIKMISAILEGERRPEVLLELCDYRIKNKKAELVLKALKGNYRDEHLFALNQAFDTWKHYNSLILQCDKQLEQYLEKITVHIEKKEAKNKRKPIRYHKPEISNLHQPLLKLSNGKDPINIAGITDYSFLQIMSEVGTNMSSWKTDKHFTSWLKLAPMKASSGKVSKRISLKRHNNAGQIFRNLAQGILNSKHLALGVFGRRIRARRGPGIAIKAIARKIATHYYWVMTKGENFVEIGIEKYQEFLKERQIKSLKRLALENNFILVEM